nr:hypothetical protein [Tanacetum cinerariifolium]
MPAAGDLDEIEEVKANCILMENLQHASTSGTQLDKALAYDTDGSAEVQLTDKCYDNDIFNMFTREEQYTDLLEPIPEPQLVPQNDNHVTSVAPSMVQSGGTVETSSTPNEETRAHQETIYRNLIAQVAQVNMVNCNMRATNAELKSELARYKIQEQRIEIKGNKKLKHDFKTREDKYLDKEVDLEAKIKVLENILLKRDQTVQNMHLLNPKPDSFYHPDQKMALGYPNPLYLKQAQLKQQSLYNGNLLLEEHDPPVVYDSEETLKLAQESCVKMRFVKKEKKPTNYAKINHLSGVFVPQTTKSKEELFLSNVSNMVTVSKTISIPNEDLSDDTTPRISVTPQVDKPKLIVVTPYPKKLHASIPLHSVPQPRELNVMKHSNENVSSDTVNSSSTGLVHTARTRRPQPKGNSRNDNVLSASKSSEAKKNVIVEDHRRNLSISKNQKTMSSKRNNIKLAIRNDKSKIIC